METMGSSVALGLFDGVHCGHRAVIAAAVDYATAQHLTPAAFTFAIESVSVKQGNPLNFLYPDTQKTAILQKCGIKRVLAPTFDVVCTMTGEAFCRDILVGELKARAVFCGEDFRFGSGATCDVTALQTFGEKMGFTVTVIPPICADGEKISSTRIRSAVHNGDMVQAARLLGEPYALQGEIIHGKAYGHTRGVPTINVAFSEGQLLPQYGVYVSKTNTRAGEYYSITNIGVKPTLEWQDKPIAETYLFDFTGDVYGETSTTQLYYFLRGERQFRDAEELYKQIECDIASCKAWWKTQKG